MYMLLSSMYITREPPIETRLAPDDTVSVTLSRVCTRQKTPTTCTPPQPPSEVHRLLRSTAEVPLPNVSKRQHGVKLRTDQERPPRVPRLTAGKDQSLHQESCRLRLAKVSAED